jgi:hypothetical protein
MIQICTFKEKERGKGRHLMANGTFQAWWSMGKHLIWWPMKGSKLDGPWNVPCLVAFGRRRRRKNIIFTSFHFSPHNILLNPFFH